MQLESYHDKYDGLLDDELMLLLSELEEPFVFNIDDDVLMSEVMSKAMLFSEVCRMFREWKQWFRQKMQTKKVEWSEEVISVWVLYLHSKSITLGEFYRAKFCSFERDWTPTNARDFLLICRKKEGLDNVVFPDSREAYLQAVAGKFSHAAIYETAKRIGSWELKTKPESLTWKLWQKVYSDVCKEVLDGKSFTLPSCKAIEQKTKQDKAVFDIEADTPEAKKIREFIEKYSSKSTKNR